MCTVQYNLLVINFGILQFLIAKVSFSKVDILGVELHFPKSSVYNLWPVNVYYWGLINTI